MTGWVKREMLEPSVSRLWANIWDGDGWQVNESTDGGFLLIDAVMPMIPASPVCGRYNTFDEAANEAVKRGKPDWSEEAE